MPRFKSMNSLVLSLLYGPALTSVHDSTESEKVKVLVAQSCPTLWDPMDCSPPSSSSMEFSRHEYWSGFPFSSLEDLPDLGIKPRSPALQAEL